MRKILLPILISLTACAPGPSQRISIDQVGAVCDDRALGSFVGQPATAEIGTKLMGFSRSRSLRWVRFGAMVTMEFSPQRLTVRLDPQGRIASLNCG